MAERKILYVLGVTTDPEAQRALKAWEKLHEETQKRGTKTEEQEAKKRAKEAEKEAAAKIRAGEKAARAAEKEARERETQERRVFQNRIKLLARIQKEEERKRQDQVRKEKAAAREVEAAWDRSQGQIAAGRALLTEGLQGGVESAARFARGIAALGLVGEESTEKLVRGIVAVQGAFDVVVGGVNIFIRLTKAVEGYRLASAGAAAQEKAARAASIAGVQAEIAAENALAASRLRSASAAGASSAARVGAAGAGAGAAAGGRAASGVIGTGGTIAAGAAAVASAAVALKLVAEAATGAADKTNSWTSRIAQWEVGVGQSIAGFFSDKTVSKWQKRFEASGDTILASIAESVLSQRAVNKATAKISAERTARLRDTLNESIEVGGISGRLAFARSRASDLAGFSVGNEGSRQAIQRQRDLLDDQSSTISRFSPRTEAGAAFKQEETLRILEAQKGIVRDNLDLERRIRQEKRDGAKDAIEGAKRELELVKERGKEASKRIQSGKEAFARLDEVEQSKAIAAITQARTKGADSLSDDQRGLLRTIGTDEARKFAEEADRAEADRLGFDRFFGSNERRVESQSAQQARKIEVEITGREKLLVQIEREEEELARAARNEVVALLDQRDRILIDKLRQELQESQRQVNATTNRQLSQRAASIGGTQ